MHVSIKKTVVAAIAALGMATAVASTPAQAQWHGGGGFHGGGFHGGGFGGGFHGGGWHGGGWGGGWHGGWGRPGWGGGGWGWRRAGWGGGWGGGCWNCGWGWAEVGAGVGIQAGRSRRRLCLSGSRSLRSPCMATVPVAGFGDGFGQPADTISAGGW